MQHVSCIVPTGHLSYAPLEPDSFYRGLRENPGAIIADAGSCDIGPYPLGANTADPANAFKFSIARKKPAGGPGESDMFGCQQYAPLFDLDIPLRVTSSV